MMSYLFPGQGSQRKGMGGALFDEFPELTDKAEGALGYSIRALCLEDEKGQLNQTQYTQPAIYVVNALSYLKRVEQTGRRPDFVAGHSLGEYNALQAAGAITFEDGLRLVRRRGELMAQARKGAMAAVLGMGETAIKRCLSQQRLESIEIANYNAPTQIVVSGLEEEVVRSQGYFQEAGGQFVRLNTSGAFHSRYMASAKAEFEQYLEGFQFGDLQIPVICNTTAKPYLQQEIERNLANQITFSVRWQQSMEYLLGEGVVEFEEVGTGKVLTRLMSSIRAGFPAGQEREAGDGVAKGEEIESKGPAIRGSSQAVGFEQRAERQQAENDSLMEIVEEWNKAHPIGTRVSVDGFEAGLKTRTRATVLLGRRAAVYMQGYKGYFPMEEVRAVSEGRAHASSETR